MRKQQVSIRGDYVNQILDDYVAIHGAGSEFLRREIALGVSRDHQARRLPPNVKIPSRRYVLSYLRTIYAHSGSLSVALQSWLKPGSWTSSGGSFRLAVENGVDFAKVLAAVCEETGAAAFLEIGAAYGGFAESNGSSSNSIKSLYEALRVEQQLNVDFHFTNLTRWHTSLPDGIFEHPGIAASTISRLAGTCNHFDVVYSQCATYFDTNVASFVHQIAGLVRESTYGGLIAFNAKPEDFGVICRAALDVELNVVFHKEIGGMNGDFLVLKKACRTIPDTDKSIERVHSRSNDC